MTTLVPIPIRQEWVNITAQANLEDNKEYLIDFESIGDNSVVRQACTDGSAVADDVQGHPIYTFTQASAYAPREYLQVAGTALWMRADISVVAVHVTELDR